ncbi:MAG: CsbD family protein [Terracidiphilus sp.]
MNRARVKGMIDEVAGSAKRKAGGMTGNTKLQVEGIVQQAKGKVESAWGQAKDAVRDVIEDTELHLDAHVTLRSKNSTADPACSKGK